jgi:SAM-dependent methyltransferase
MNGTEVEAVFSDIYRRNAWGSESSSGPGSIRRNASRYVRVLQRLLKRNKVRSVVDLGCGDWAFSQAIDWSGIDYLGVDVVPGIIAANQARFRRDNVRFRAGSLLAPDLPGADLVVVKDVLQHLPNAIIQEFLGRLSRFRFALVTNDIFEYELPDRWRSPLSELKKIGWRIKSINADVPAGGWRPLDVSRAPFRLPGQRLTRYALHIPPSFYIKDVFLWTNPDPVA